MRGRIHVGNQFCCFFYAIRTIVPGQSLSRRIVVRYYQTKKQRQSKSIGWHDTIEVMRDLTLCRSHEGHPTVVRWVRRRRFRLLVCVVGPSGGFEDRFGKGRPGRRCCRGTRRLLVPRSGFVVNDDACVYAVACARCVFALTFWLLRDIVFASRRDYAERCRSLGKPMQVFPVWVWQFEAVPDANCRQC